MHIIHELLQRSGSFVIGHRGAAGLAAENTLPSFAKALDWRCPMIELDVQLCGSRSNRQNLVVIHDKKLNRTTNGKGLVADYSLAELRKFDAGGGAKIPLLSEVFALLQNHQAETGQTVALNIELKGSQTAAAVAQTVQFYQDWPVLVSSFDHQELQAFRHLDTHTPVAPLYDKYRSNWLEVARGLGACGINMGLKITNAARVEAMSRAGYPVSVYTVNDPATALKLKAMGVRGIFSDRPDLLTPAIAD